VPPELHGRVVEMTQRIESGSRRWARAIFGKEGRDEIRLAQFLISELPIATVRQHLLRGEAPPQLIDQIIRTTYRAVVADYRTRKSVRAPQRLNDMHKAARRHCPGPTCYQAGMKRQNPARRRIRMPQVAV
jgi:hypothetical protein